jgi:hypothetical protein
MADATVPPRQSLRRIGQRHAALDSDRIPQSRVLGFGDYEHPDSDSRQRAGRRYFLEVVRDQRRDVLSSLIAHVLPAYANLAMSPDAFARLSWEEDEARADVRRGDLPPLHTWAENWRLDVPWVKKRALATLHMWRAFLESRSRIA